MNRRIYPFGKIFKLTPATRALHHFKTPYDEGLKQGNEKEWKEGEKNKTKTLTLFCVTSYRTGRKILTPQK
jgi:hypothetical protein